MLSIKLPKDKIVAKTEKAYLVRIPSTKSKGIWVSAKFCEIDGNDDGLVVKFYQEWKSEIIELDRPDKKKVSFGEKKMVDIFNMS